MNIKIPPHLIGKKISKLSRWANKMRGHYGTPVYLVGSSLTNENPRDYDIRICLPDKDFMMRYSCNDIEQFCLRLDSGLWDDSNWLWSDDRLKMTKRGWNTTNLNIDFQIYPIRLWNEFKNKDKLQIDTRQIVDEYEKC